MTCWLLHSGGGQRECYHLFVCMFAYVHAFSYICQECICIDYVCVHACHLKQFFLKLR